MEPQFSPPQKPVPRPAGRGSGGPRESNALRASVLDAALELGLVSNAGWMFDNALQEENEEEGQASSPGLTYGSSVTSEESFPSMLSPSSSSEVHANATATFLPSLSKQLFTPGSEGYGGAPPIPSAVRKETAVRIVEPDFHERFLAGVQVGVPFPESSVPVRPTTPGGGRKLKKKKGPDGYETDGGYMSDAGKKKDKKKDKDKEREKKSQPGLTTATDMEMLGLVETSKEAKKRAKEEKKEAEAERKRTKSLLSAAKAARKKDGNSRDGGYDTDSGGKAKAKPKKSSVDASGYETDGTPVKRSKSRFFKLGSKASKSDLRTEAEAVPPLPFSAHREQDKEAVPLPIAERFATTLSPTFFNTPINASPAEGRSPSPFPPLSFQLLGASTSGAGSPISPDRTAAATPMSAFDNRSSQFSAVSSTSSGSRFRAQPDGGPSKHHGTDSGTSYSSTITSPFAHQQQTPPPAQPPAVSVTSSSEQSQGAGSKSGLGVGLGSGALHPPAISFSTSRSPSPSRAPPVLPLSIMKSPRLRLKASLDTLIGARNATPSPISPAPLSPFVMVPSPTALQSSAPSPTTGVPPPSPMSERSLNGHSDGSGSGSGFGIGTGVGFRARSPAAQSPRAVISSPNTAMNITTPAANTTPTTTIATNSNISINTANVESPTHLNIVPSSNYLVTSPRNSGLPSPNVLAYYDLPPPSPAPQGPLPIPPTGVAPFTAAVIPNSPNSHVHLTHLPSPAALRQRVIDRTPRALPPELSAALHGQVIVQRGRESPFPARPVLPVANIPPTPAGAGLGLEARMATRRYRDLYVPLSSGTTGPGAAGAVDMERYQEEKEQAMERRRARLAGEREHSWIIDAEDSEGANDADNGDEADSQELRGVLDRFAADSTESVESRTNARALGRRRSSDAIQVNVVRVAGTSGSFEFADDGRTVGDRMSRWSGSIYSRASILDPDESGETRERLVKQVEAMLDAERRAGGTGLGTAIEGERGYVPPVPRLPAAYANMGSQVNAASSGRTWNRF